MPGHRRRVAEREVGVGVAVDVGRPSPRARCRGRAGTRRRVLFIQVIGTRPNRCSARPNAACDRGLRSVNLARSRSISCGSRSRLITVTSPHSSESDSRSYRQVRRRRMRRTRARSRTLPDRADAASGRPAKLRRCVAPDAAVRGRSVANPTAAASETGTTAASIPAVPSGISALSRPSISSAPAAETVPASQHDSTKRYGARCSRCRSNTVSGPSSRIRSREQRVVVAERPVCRDVRERCPVQCAQHLRHTGRPGVTSDNPGRWVEV